MKSFTGLRSEAEILGVSSHSGNSHLCFPGRHGAGRCRAALGPGSKSSWGLSAARVPPPTGMLGTETQTLPTCGCEGLRVLSLTVPGSVSCQVDGKGVARWPPSLGLSPPTPHAARPFPDTALHGSSLPERAPLQPPCLRCNPGLRLDTLTGCPGCSPRGWRCA